MLTWIESRYPLILCSKNRVSVHYLHRARIDFDEAGIYLEQITERYPDAKQVTTIIKEMLQDTAQTNHTNPCITYKDIEYKKDLSKA
ncbi:hypothetical protein [Niabella ginsengisoli]|uniref:Tetratricopeptide repeat protein n=1 Tax=Niabella ginsengisoli TaxID=522298 RepID=A0ABS9SHX9_9BACT|nr:hypothetical protein [Niabella ginsengisoli]MCH5597945.1 hypothetical protein [Niabella ginsengisoli]